MGERGAREAEGTRFQGVWSVVRTASIFVLCPAHLRVVLGGPCQRWNAQRPLQTKRAPACERPLQSFCFFLLRPATQHGARDEQFYSPECTVQERQDEVGVQPVRLIPLRRGVCLRPFSPPHFPAVVAHSTGLVGNGCPMRRRLPIHSAI